MEELHCPEGIEPMVERILQPFCMPVLDEEPGPGRGKALTAEKSAEVG
jgi:hypothetical protein